MDRGYWQLSVLVNKSDKELVNSLLDKYMALAIIYESADETLAFDEGDGQSPNWGYQKISGIFHLNIDLGELEGALNEAGFEVHVSTIAESDWALSGLDQFKQIKISDNLWVCPSWLTPPDVNAINLIIDPGLAFGTGMHATTQLCLKQLTKMDCLNKSIIDYGCGSGILAIAGLKFGASSAIAIDNDEQSIKTALKNGRINNVDERLSVLPPPEDIGFELAPVDIVIANILKPVLISLRSLIVSLAKPGGILILSGVLEHQQSCIVEHYSDYIDFNVEQDGDWLVMMGTRR